MIPESNGCELRPQLVDITTGYKWLEQFMGAYLSAPPFISEWKLPALGSVAKIPKVAQKSN